VAQRAVFRKDPLDQQFSLATGFFVPEQTRRNHARVVADQQVAWFEEFGQVAKLVICDGTAAAIENQ
jgi:hypothetical protein